MLENPNEAVLRLLEESDRALAAFDNLKRIADARLGGAAPSLAAVEDALKRIRQVIGRTRAGQGHRRRRCRQRFG